MTILEQMAVGQAPNIVPLTVGQYHRMISEGILCEGEPIELIDGILVRKDCGDRGGKPMSHGPRHGSTIVALQENLGGVTASGARLRIQLPVTLADNQEPEPDVGVVRGSRQAFFKSHPGPGDLVAVMEVSDSSLAFDRTTKQRLYANAAISVYWIVNLVEQQIEVYAAPRPGQGEYASRTDFMPGQTVSLTVAPGVEIAVAVSAILVT